MLNLQTNTFLNMKEEKQSSAISLLPAQLHDSFRIYLQSNALLFGAFIYGAFGTIALFVHSVTNEKKMLHRKCKESVIPKQKDQSVQTGLLHLWAPLWYSESAVSCAAISTLYQLIISPWIFHFISASPLDKELGTGLPWKDSLLKTSRISHGKLDPPRN